MKAKAYTFHRKTVEDELQFERMLRCSFEQEANDQKLLMEKSRESFLALVQIARNFEKTTSKPRERARYKALADMAVGVLNDLRGAHFSKGDERKEYDDYLEKNPCS